MLQNARVTAFTISELLRENQQGGKLPNYRKYDVIIMPQVISIKTFYTSKGTSFFTFLLFLNVLPDCTRRI